MTIAAKRDIRDILRTLPNIEAADKTYPWWTDLSYPTYTEISRIFQPSGILELGTKLGYSLISMIHGSDQRIVRYAWIDNETALENSNNRCRHNLFDYTYGLNNMTANLGCVSRHEELIEFEKHDFQLIHYDSDHSTRATLAWVAQCCGMWPKAVILIDDTSAAHVRQAVETVSRVTGLDASFIPTANGLGVLTNRDQSIELYTKFKLLPLETTWTP